MDRTHRLGEPVTNCCHQARPGDPSLKGASGYLPKRDNRDRLGYDIFSLRRTRQRAVDHVDGVLQAVDRHERTETRTFLQAK